MSIVEKPFLSVNADILAFCGTIRESKQKEDDIYEATHP
ncbi:hypothetical protein B4145_4226 [Bacillus subtilis]|uniref:Uncharacterized protein n=1 Tax=Bacillus subtilis subsp. subtilis TaxID=135461 RepID=A0ABD3ZZL2_BACIU|nr:hypothetical protein B4067_4315 [Bacillus subtilis subsp. subtilis]KIN58947.1 hypothetical protein B4145_4226 [Bacillus subtilis]